MGAIIMQSTASAILKIINNYPQFIFKKSDDFLWSSSDNTIFYNPKDVHALALLLHELAHALLGHKLYLSDVQLISIESQTWDYAVNLAESYNIVIPEEIVQSNLDTYRDWQHERSTCPKCTATGMQIKNNIYSCLACSNQWKVNQARDCRLQRHDITK